MSKKKSNSGKKVVKKRVKKKRAKTETPSTSSEPTPIRRRFGNILQKVRKVRGKSIYKLAEEAEVDAGYISRLENAYRNPPTPKTLQKLADALNFPCRLLMMAAGYLELDEDGQPFTEKNLIRQVEAVLTGSKSEALESEVSVKYSEARDVIQQFEELKLSVIKALEGSLTVEIPVLDHIPPEFPKGLEGCSKKLSMDSTKLPDDPNVFVWVASDAIPEIGIVEGDYIVLSPMLKNILGQGDICLIRFEDDNIVLGQIYFSEEGVTLKIGEQEICQDRVAVLGKAISLVRAF